MRAAFLALQVVEVPDSAVSLAEAIRSYLFNAQLITLPQGGMALIVPGECRESKSVWNWIEAMLAGNGPIREVIPVEVRQTMATGGGPACTRLRVGADTAPVGPPLTLSPPQTEQLTPLTPRNHVQSG